AAPRIAQVGDFLDQRAVTKHAIARHIGADVDVLAELRQARIARLRHGEQRTGLRIALAEEPELVGVFARQDADVALHVARRHAPGGRGELAWPDGAADLARLVHRPNDSG